MRTADYSTSLFERSLRDKIGDRLQSLAEQACTGSSIDDQAAYRHLVGRIASLREVLDMMVTVNSEINRSIRD